MGPWRHWLVACLFSLAVLGSPAAWAALCSQVFPANTTANGVDLTSAIDAIFGPQPSYSTFSGASVYYSTPGEWFYQSGTLATWSTITVKAGATTWLFFDGDLNLQPQSSINTGGNPADLVIVVRGNLNIGTKNAINALLYATGNVNVQPQADVLGAITAKGTVTLGSNASVTYDATAAAGFNLPGLCSDGKLHHYQLAYASQALTCQPQAITVSACVDAACSTTYAGTSSLTVSPGGTPITFTASTSTPIAVRTAQTVSLAVSGANPAPASSTLCRIDGGAASSNCSLTFADSGLLVQAPDLIAGKADTLTVTAVRKSDNAASCVPAFANVSRPVQFWSTYVAPDAATQVGNRPVLLGGGAISGNRGSPTTLTLNFNASGQAPLLLNYADAGQVQIDARYVGSSASGDVGLTMDGADTFISRPYGLHLSTDASCSAASVAGCTVLRAAGDSFPLRIRAVAWQADGEPRTAAALADNPSTPNFRLSGIALASTLAAPAGGDNGSLSPASYSHVLGSQTTLDLSESEVGVFTISATPPSGGYFGYTVDGGESDLVGRFTPAYLQASASAQLTPACGATFSYQQQEIGFATGQTPRLTVTGYNRQGAVTRNYDRGEFWRLSAPQRQDYLSISGRPTLDAAGRLQTLGDAQSTALSDASPGDGARQFAWVGDRLRWTAALQPQTDDLPFPSVAGTAIARLALLAAQLRDADGICYGSAGCSDFAFDFGGSEVRLGRLRFGNAFGSELQALDVPFWLESWQNIGTVLAPLGSFRPESGDSCSAPLLGAAALKQVAGAVRPADFGTPAVLAPVAGQGAVRLPAPGKEGSVSVGLVGLEVISPGKVEVDLPWLLYDWNADAATREASRGLATFGIYRGSDALIFRRELYR
jgi:MSHA biogenesis protein MshQ